MKGLTIKQIVQQASNLLGVDLIDDNFSLFTNQDEGSINWLSFMNMAFDEIIKDIYDKNVVFNISNSKLELIPDTQYSYDISSLPISKILSVKNNGKSIYKVVSYSKLNNCSYIEKHNSIETSFLSNDLYIEYLDSRIYVDATGDLSNQLISDNDKTIIDNSLIIFKLCSLVSEFKSMDFTQFYTQKYMERLNYIVQDSLRNRKPLYL